MHYGARSVCGTANGFALAYESQIIRQSLPAKLFSTGLRAASEWAALVMRARTNASLVAHTLHHALHVKDRRMQVFIRRLPLAIEIRA